LHTGPLVLQLSKNKLSTWYLLSYIVKSKQKSMHRWPCWALSFIISAWR